MMALPHKNVKNVNFSEFSHIKLKEIGALYDFYNDMLQHALQHLFLVSCDRCKLPNVIEQNPQKDTFL